MRECRVRAQAGVSQLVPHPADLRAAVEHGEGAPGALEIIPRREATGGLTCRTGASETGAEGPETAQVNQLLRQHALNLKYSVAWEPQRQIKPSSRETNATEPSSEHNHIVILHILAPRAVSPRWRDETDENPLPLKPYCIGWIPKSSKD